ncbi:accessory Sec system protein Asp2 [Streptococcus dysgalactiae]|uniref:accessory Sec system protein Asp2 n=1 Tax=Streptococcus dysgalactiae TaxID=1334 RepID=UPI003D71BC8D
MSEMMRILQVGGKDKSLDFSLPDQMEWHYVSAEGLEIYLKTLLEKEIPAENNRPGLQEVGKSVVLTPNWQFDAVLLMTYLDEAKLEPLSAWVEAHAVFYAKTLSMSASQTGFLRRKIARPLDLLTQNDSSELVSFFQLALFKGQYGDKLHVSDSDIFSNFRGEISFQGHASLTFEGDFGEELTPLFAFKYGIPMEKVATALWWEFEREGVVTLALSIDHIYTGAIDEIKNSQMVSDDALSSPILLYPDAEVGQYNVTVYAKGKGKLLSGPLHRRLSRLGLGELLVGGQVYRNDKRQEVLTYFHPGDMKPPLSVYFSGFRSAEGFEGFHMMKEMGTPFLLISDPRLEGGSFYIGNSDYQEIIVSAIKEALDYLGFDNSQLILSGLSMGTYGALYYAADLEPYALIVGKPFTNIGDTAMNMCLKRPDDFETSADILLGLVGANDSVAAEQVDAQFWEHFKQADFSKTQFAIAYMLDDDYDQKAYDRLLTYASDKSFHLFGKGYTGRHNDNSEAIIKWFLDQYRIFLEDDFGRSRI